MMMLAGLVFLPAGLAWTSIIAPIWITQWLAVDKTRLEFSVVAVERVGRFREARLRDARGGSEVSLPLAGGFASSPIQRGEVICAKVKRSFAGAIVEELRSGPC